MWDCSGKVRCLQKKNGKTRIVLSRIYREREDIYYVVERHAWDKESKKIFFLFSPKIKKIS